MARVSISDVYAPGQIINVQKSDGLENTYQVTSAGAAASVGATQVTRDAAGTPFQLSYTPPVNCWWEITGKMYTYRPEAVYCYSYVYTRLSPADADGQADIIGIASGQYAGVVTYYTHPIPGHLYKLTAGVAYTVSMLVAWNNYTGTGNSLQIYRGAGFTSLYAKAIVR